MFSNLRSRLLMLVFLAVVPAAALIIYTGLEARHDATNQARTDNQTIAELAATQQEQLLEGSRQVLVTLAPIVKAIDLTKAEPSTCGTGTLATLVKETPAYANIGIANAKGDIVCSGVPTTAVVNAADRPWFQRAVETGGFSVGDYQVGRITGTQSLSVSLPLYDKTGNLSSVLFLSLDLRKLNESLASLQLSKDTVLNVTDPNGTIVARSSDPDSWLGKTLSEAAEFHTDFDPAASDQAPASPGGAAGSGSGVGSASGGPAALDPTPVNLTRVAELKGDDGVNRLYAFTPIGAGTGLYASASIPKSAAFASANSALLRNLVLLLVVAALAMVAAWFGGDFFFLKRTRALVAATEKLGAGDRTARTGLHDSSELGKLAASFDSMAATLERNAKERDEALEELGRRNQELEAFTYSVSHDLKEPLRTLKTFSQFMLQDYGDVVEDEGKEYLEGIGDASVRMARQIDELLAMSRLSRDAPATRVDLQELLGGIIAAHRGAIEAKGAKVTVQPGLPDVLAHAPRVEQIFSNLLSNALKFNDKDHPVVEIGALETRDGMATLYVRDNGVGIDPEFHEVIFNLFHRLNRREAFEGTGAGLAIAKRAAEVSDGSIRLESVLGEGTTFYVSLPVWEPVARSQAA
jgi:signal transduction histidine kinase